MGKQATVKRIRKNFGSIHSAISMPNLLQLQTDSYRDFVGVGGGRRDINGSSLADVFRGVFPIRDYSGNAELGFESL